MNVDPMHKIRASAQDTPGKKTERVTKNQIRITVTGVRKYKCIRQWPVIRSNRTPNC